MSTFETKVKKMFETDLNCEQICTDLKEELDLKNRCLFRLFGPLAYLNMPASAEICPNVGKYSSISVTKKVTS